MSLLSMVTGLTDAGVAFVVIGGVAARAQGSTHITEDLDICYDTEPPNLECLADLLACWHAYPREVETGLPFIMDAKTLSTSPVLTLTTDEGDLDLFDAVEGVGDYRAVQKVSVRIDAGAVEFLALSLRGLIKAKRATKRPKDLGQLPELEALVELQRRKR